MKLETASFFDEFIKKLKRGKSFTLTGLTAFSRLLLLKYIKDYSDKKVILITSTEQSALRYSADFERLFNLIPQTIPYQNTSPYDTVIYSLYDYQKQISILKNRPNVVISPVKT